MIKSAKEVSSKLIASFIGKGYVIEYAIMHNEVPTANLTNHQSSHHALINVVTEQLGIGPIEMDMIKVRSDDPSIEDIDIPIKLIDGLPGYSADMDESQVKYYENL